MLSTLGEYAGIALVTIGFWLATGPGVALIVLGVLVYAQATLYALTAGRPTEDGDES